MYAAVEAIAHQDDVFPRLRCATCCESAGPPTTPGGIGPSGRERRDAELVPLVRTLFWKHRRRYGARRIASELADLGELWPTTRGKTAENAGAAGHPAKIVCSQDDRQPAPLGLQSQSAPGRPGTGSINKLWVGDITYIPLRAASFCYLAMLMDRYSRFLVGWKSARP